MMKVSDAVEDRCVEWTPATGERSHVFPSREQPGPTMPAIDTRWKRRYFTVESVRKKYVFLPLKQGRKLVTAGASLELSATGFRFGRYRVRAGSKPGMKIAVRMAVNVNISLFRSTFRRIYGAVFE
ncbi:MAG: hypothetical protein QMB52_12280 [Propionivibrio sp.]